MRFLPLMLISTALLSTPNTYAMLSTDNLTDYNVSRNKSDYTAKLLDPAFGKTWDKLEENEQIKLQNLLIQRGYHVLDGIYYNGSTPVYEEKSELLQLVKKQYNKFNLTKNSFDIKKLDLSAAVWGLYSLANKNEKNNINSKVFKRGSFSILDKADRFFAYLLQNDCYKRSLSSHYKEESIGYGQYGIDINYSFLPVSDVNNQSFKHILFGKVSCPNGATKLFFKCEEHGVGLSLEGLKHGLNFLTPGSKTPEIDYRREKDLPINSHKILYHSLLEFYDKYDALKREKSKLFNEELKSLELLTFYEKYKEIEKNYIKHIRKTGNTIIQKADPDSTDDFIFLYGTKDRVKDVIEFAHSNTDARKNLPKFTFNMIAKMLSGNSKLNSNFNNYLKVYSFEENEKNYRTGNECVLDVSSELEILANFMLLEHDFSEEFTIKADNNIVAAYLNNTSVTKSIAAYELDISKGRSCGNTSNDDDFVEITSPIYHLDVFSMFYDFLKVEGLDFQTIYEYRNIIQNSIDPYSVISVLGSNVFENYIAFSDDTFNSQMGGPKIERTKTQINQAIYLKKLLTDNNFSTFVKSSLSVFKKSVEEAKGNKEEIKKSFNIKVEEIIGQNFISDDKELTIKNYIKNIISSESENIFREIEYLQKSRKDNSIKICKQHLENIANHITTLSNENQNDCNKDKILKLQDEITNLNAHIEELQDESFVFPDVWALYDEKARTLWFECFDLLGYSFDVETCVNFKALKKKYDSNHSLFQMEGGREYLTNITPMQMGSLTEFSKLIYNLENPQSGDYWQYLSQMFFNTWANLSVQSKIDYCKNLYQGNTQQDSSKE